MITRSTSYVVGLSIVIPLLAILSLVTPTTVSAHDVRPGYLELRETTTGVFQRALEEAGPGRDDPQDRSGVLWRVRRGRYRVGGRPRAAAYVARATLRVCG